MSKTPTELSVKFVNKIQSKFLDGIEKAFATAQGNFYTSYTFYDIEAGLKYDRIISNSSVVSNVEWRNEYPSLSFAEYLETKVEAQRARANGRSVFAFVERATKKLVKAAGWSQPAKLSNGQLQSKYNLSDDAEFDIAVAEADPHGSFLYVR